MNNSSTMIQTTFFKVIGDPPFRTKYIPDVLQEMKKVGLNDFTLIKPRGNLSDVGPSQVLDDETSRVEVLARMGPFKFARYWRYWVVTGPVPLELAGRMYADPVGRQDVRVAGHCGCPPPAEWATNINGKACVTTYHIDSLEGLQLFVRTVEGGLK